MNRRETRLLKALWTAFAAGERDFSDINLAHLDLSHWSLKQSRFVGRKLYGHQFNSGLIARG